jgi:hypothetical protein
MFIIEGGDSLGKTSLARKICIEANKRREFAQITYSHMSRPDLNTFDFCYDYVKMINMYSVQDRFHLGGLVYHNTKDKEYFPREKLHFVEGHLRTNGAFILLLTTSDADWYEEKLKSENREQMYDIDKMLEYESKFNSLLSCSDVMIDDVRHIADDDYPTDNEIQFWVNQWFARLRVAATYKAMSDKEESGT